MPKSASTTCPSCGAEASGRFCANCGAQLGGAFCADCGKPLTPGVRFCPNCGAAAGAAGAASAAGGPAMRNSLVWLVPGIAVFALVAFLIGQRVGRGGSAGDTAAASPNVPLSGGPIMASGGGTAATTDISQMSPEERAKRLFDRVMRYGETGKLDSAEFFAPMAIQSYEMLGNLSLHNRYDMGLIAAVAGSPDVAQAQADTILKKNPTYLLGLILAAKTAALRKDNAAMASYQKRFLAAEPSERAKKLPEYEEHKADIDAALTAIRNRKP